MIAYIFFKESKIISCKIDNVESILELDKEIKGENGLIKYGDSQDFIILESDVINLNNGNIINMDGLIDERLFFINKEQWYKEQIKKNKETINIQQNTITKINEDMNTALLGIADVYEQILSGGSTT